MSLSNEFLMLFGRRICRLCSARFGTFTFFTTLFVFGVCGSRGFCPGEGTRVIASRSKRNQMSRESEDVDLLMVRRLLPPALFSFALLVEWTLDDYCFALLCDRILITSATSLPPIGGDDPDFCLASVFGGWWGSEANWGDWIGLALSWMSFAPRLSPL